MQKMIVGYESALEFWRRARAASLTPAEDDAMGRVYGARQLDPAELSARAAGMMGVEEPIDVIVAERGERRWNSSARYHLWKGPLDDRYLLGLGGGVFVCTMPAVLVQLARTYERIELARVAYEMSGTYGLTPWASDTKAQDLRPVVDVADMRAYALSARATKVRGAERALEALRIVVNGSNSPRETDLGIFLASSRAVGGAGLSGFRMNERFKLPDELADRLRQSSVIPDFSWYDRVIMEYDSDEEHLSPEAKARDERKRRAYRDVGLDCLTMTSDIPASNRKLNGFIEDLEKSLRIRRRPLTPKMLDARAELREALFGPEAVGEALDALNQGDGAAESAHYSS